MLESDKKKALAEVQDLRLQLKEQPNLSRESSRDAKPQLRRLQEQVPSIFFLISQESQILEFSFFYNFFLK